MDLNELIDRQRRFDSERHTTFEWSAPITPESSHALLHNVLSLAGEAGEVANLAKKFDRGDFDFDHLLRELPGELADVVLYVLKIAYQSGIDLEAAIVEKMALNEIRFPMVVQGANEHSQQGEAIISQAQYLASSLSKKELDSLSHFYESADAPVPESAADRVIGLLLAVQVAKLADLELNFEEQERRWKDLERTATSIHLSYHQLVAMTRRSDEVIRLLGIDRRTVSPA